MRPRNDELIHRIEQLEKETRFLKRGAAVVLSLIAIGVLVLQGVTTSHIQSPTNPHNRRNKGKPPQAEAPEKPAAETKAKRDQ